jgi:hypothetical protein
MGSQKKPGGTMGAFGSRLGSSLLVLAPPRSPCPPWLLLTFPGLSWLPLAPPGPGFLWLLLAPSGSSWLLMDLPGSPWLPLAPHGSSWLPVAPRHTRILKHVGLF